MSYSSRAHEAGGWDKIDAAPPRGPMDCEECGRDTPTRYRHENGVWRCPSCFAKTDVQLENAGQLTFAPDICVEEAA